MDPLSITASIIAVLQASSATGATITKLRSLRKAPEEFDELMNEVEALRSLLLIIQTSLKSIHNTAEYAEIAEPLGLLLSRAESAVTAFESLVEYQLRKDEGTDKHGRSKVDRIEWLRAGPSITRIKQRIRDAHDRLSTALNAYHLRTGEQTRQLVLQIQSVQLSQVQAVVQLQSTLQASPEASSNQALLPESFAHNLSIRGGLGAVAYHTNSPTAGVVGQVLPHAGPKYIENTFSISATMSHNECPPLCGCQCHAKTRGRTPDLLKSIIGQLMFDFTSLILVKPCNVAQCRKSAHKCHFLYRFPAWLTFKMIAISGSIGSKSDAGAEWALKIPVIVTGWRAWNAVFNNNLALIRKMLAGREIGPHMLNVNGQSLVQKSFVGGQVEIYNTLVQAGFPDILQTSGFVDVNLAYRMVKHSHLDPSEISEYLGFTQLHYAIAFDDGQGASLETLQEYAEDINKQDRSGQTPLHWACRYKQPAIVKLLLFGKANRNTRTFHGKTPLAIACRYNDAESAKALLKAGAFVDCPNDLNQTPLFSAYYKDVIRVLLEHGANVNHRDHRGRTSLHMHATVDSDTVEDLVLAGANYGLVNNTGWSAVHYAIFGDSLISLRHLREVHDHSPIERRPVSDKHGKNFLHFAAMYAGPALYKELANWDLRMHHPYMHDSYGDPDARFYNDRDRSCTHLRAPFEEEEEAWITLMESASRQNDCEYRRRNICRQCQTVEFRAWGRNNARDVEYARWKEETARFLCGNCEGVMKEEDTEEDEFVDASET